jgi:hypothetical protein
MIIIVLGIVALTAMVALVVDLGSWFRENRQLQSIADASALAGAFNLPDVSGAQTHATSFFNTNKSNNALTGAAITFPAPQPSGGVCSNNGCIAVDATDGNVPGFFTKIASSIANVTIKAHAQAAIEVPADMNDVAPVAVLNTVACTGPPACTFPHAATINFDAQPNSYQLLDLNIHSASGPVGGANASTSQMNSWITGGYPSALPAPAWYAANNGVKNGVKKGFNTAAANQTILLIPVFDQIDQATGSVHVIGWAAFLIDPNGVGKWTGNGNQGTHTLTGSYVRFIANGLQPATNQGQNFGVFTIVLNG